MIDSDAVQKTMAEIRDAEPWILGCFERCQNSVDLFEAVALVSLKASDQPEKLQQLVTMQVLGIRVLNSIGAAHELLLRGYFQPVAILLRDILECAYLLDLFSRTSEHLPKWIALGDEAGLNEYGPGHVRSLLNKMDRVDKEMRHRGYQWLSREAGHPTPSGVGLIAPNGQVEIGPFVDQPRLIGLTYYLTMYSVLAATHLAHWVKDIDLEDGVYFDRLNGAAEAINGTFFGLNEHLKTAPGRPSRNTAN